MHLISKQFGHLQVKMSKTFIFHNTRIRKVHLLPVSLLL